jgi:predicted heme/steroid binding protein/uncharacterized membrane protein
MEKQFDPETLLKADGKDGKPVYVAHKGKVIDVSGSALWKGGLHMGRHYAGRDLTSDIEAAPHGPEMLDRYPRVGVLKGKGTPERPVPEFLAFLLKRFPVLRRHPHPVMVHFPTVFMLSATFFSLLYLVTGNRSFELTALHTLAGGVLFTPLAIITGFFTWWLNYMAKPIGAVKIKQVCSLIMLVIALTALVWRLVMPDVLDRVTGTGALYLVLVIILFSRSAISGAPLPFP